MIHVEEGRYGTVTRAVISDNRSAVNAADDELETMIREVEEQMGAIRAKDGSRDDGDLVRHHALARRRVALLTAQHALACSETQTHI